MLCWMASFESLSCTCLHFRHEFMWYLPAYRFTHWSRNQVSPLFQSIANVVVIVWCWEHLCILQDAGTNAAIAPPATQGQFFLGSNSIACYPIFIWFSLRSICFFYPLIQQHNACCFDLPSKRSFAALISLTRLLLLLHALAMWCFIAKPSTCSWLTLQPAYPLRLLSSANHRPMFRLLDTKRTKKNKKWNAFMYKAVRDALFCHTQCNFSPKLLVGTRYCVVTDVPIPASTI